MRIYKIDSLEANQRLDKYLHKLLNSAGTGFIYKMLRKKTITLNGKKAEGSVILKEGDIVKMYMLDETIDKFIDTTPEIKGYQKAYKSLKAKIQIVYEDENVLIINKPVGVLSQKAEKDDISCNEWLLGYMLFTDQIAIKQLQTFKPSICNRLDRNTSGLLICGKTLAGTQKMNQLIKDRTIKKFYRTFVKGDFKERVHIAGYLKKNILTNKVMIVQEPVDGSDRIETIFMPIEHTKEISYLEVELITGKTHQIRAHAASMGHPVLGDYKYGDKHTNEIFRLKSQLLHAYRLEFPKMDKEFASLSKKTIVATEPEKFNKIRQYMHNMR